MTLSAGGSSVRLETPRSSDPAVTSYCQRLSAVLNLSADADRQLLQSMLSYRQACPEKFRELLRVHLSFLVDLPHFDNDNDCGGSSWKRKCYLHGLLRLPSPLRFRERGCILGRTRSGGPAGHALPHDPQHLCEADVNRISLLIGFLTENDRYKAEGLFRKTGNCARQKVLHRQLTAVSAEQCSSSTQSRGTQLVRIPDNTTVHDAANVLKMLLRGGDDRPTILSSGLADVLLSIGELTSADSLLGRTDCEQQLASCRQRRALRLFQQLLPEPNAAALQAVLRLLNLVASCPETRMNVDSLGTVFGPVLLGGRLKQMEFHWLQKVELHNRTVALLISNCSLLGQVPRTFAEEAAGHWSALLLLVPESAGSPVRFTRRTDSTAIGDCDPTADLCAHIHRMPESRRKRQLEKRLAEHAKSCRKRQEPQQTQQPQSLQKRLRLRSWTRLVAPATVDCDSPNSATAEESRIRLSQTQPCGRESSSSNVGLCGSYRSLNNSLGSADAEGRQSRSLSRSSGRRSSQPIAVAVDNAEELSALSGPVKRRPFLETAL